MDNIIPNCNPNLVVLRVWGETVDGGSESELPIIAWRIVEDDAPIPITTEGDVPEFSKESKWMIYDRATETGEDIYTREKCIESLHARCARAKQGVK